jgi:hypothetical protein
MHAEHFDYGGSGVDGLYNYLNWAKGIDRIGKENNRLKAPHVSGGGAQRSRNLGHGIRGSYVGPQLDEGPATVANADFHPGGAGVYRSGNP